MHILHIENVQYMYIKFGVSVTLFHTFFRFSHIKKTQCVHQIKTNLKVCILQIKIMYFNIIYNKLVDFNHFIIIYARVLLINITNKSY